MRKFLFLLTFILLSIKIAPYVLAEFEHDPLILPAIGGTVEEQEQKIQELEKKVTDLQKQAKTLSGQIAYYDSQIQLTTLKITQTEGLIDSISTKITTLETKLEERAKILEKQIVQTYKQGRSPPLTLLFGSEDFSQVVSKAKYIQIVQTNSRKILYDTQRVQTSYAEQKVLMQESRKKLEAQKVSLASLKVDKDNLLKQTKNDEVLYQKQLEQAKLELESIRQALALGKKEGPVKKGDPIALIGNSGYPSCSTGAHLHFEVRQNDHWVNAESYLSAFTDIDGQRIGSGSWDWPLKGNINVTQRYGKTPYSYRYISSGGMHTGVDMVSNEKTIYAVADGTLYSYTGKCGSSALNIKYIDHGGGIKSLYLHVQ